MKTLIIGATGMVGQSVLREALAAEDVSEVVTFGRTPAPQSHVKLRQVIAPDLMNAPEQWAEIGAVEVCFYCLGVSAGGMSEADYRRLTHDLTLNIAKNLRQTSPYMKFVYLSGEGADSSEQGKTMWARVRGATENALLKQDLRAVYCLRPMFILPKHGVRSKTAAYRWFYYAITPFFPLLQWHPAVLTSEQLANAMLNLARFGEERAVLSAREIKNWAQRQR